MSSSALATKPMPDSLVSCSTCSRLGHECYNCHIRRENTEVNSSLPQSLIPNADLSIRQLLFIESYMATLSITEAAKLSKISPATAYNYFSDPVVRAEIRARHFVELEQDRGKVKEALVNGAVDPESKGQAAMQRIFWQLIGDLKDRKEITGPDGGPIQVSNNHNFDSLTIEEKRTLIALTEKVSGQKVIDVSSRVIQDDDDQEIEQEVRVASRSVAMPIPREYLVK